VDFAYVWYSSHNEGGKNDQKIAELKELSKDLIVWKMQHRKGE
jgi:hypothetical protein